MTSANHNLPMDRLEAAARLQADIGGGKVTNPRRVWEPRVADVWGVTVDGAGRRSNAFLRVAGDRVTVPAGMAQAARELAAMKVLEGGSWNGGLAYVVAAAGGMTPGWPDSFDAAEDARAGGGVTVTLKMPETWVAWAASGAVGPAPPLPSGGGGVQVPQPDGNAILEIAPDYEIKWRYRFAGKEVAGCGGRPAAAPPAMSDGDLIKALAGARRKANAPRAMPASEPRPLAGTPRSVTVELCGIGPVQVDLDAAGTP